MAYLNEMMIMAMAGLQLPAAEIAPYFYGVALVLTYQLLRTQKRKLMAFG